MFALFAAFSIALNIPGYHRELESDINRIHQCLREKTCTSKYDPSREAYIITYNEPETTEEKL